jgi:hypothetical protein
MVNCERIQEHTGGMMPLMGMLKKYINIHAQLSAEMAVHQKSTRLSS